MHGTNVEFGNLISGKCSLLEGNIYNFEGKCTIKMYISVFFLQKKIWKFIKILHFWCNFWQYSRQILHFFLPWCCVKLKTWNTVRSLIWVRPKGLPTLWFDQLFQGYMVPSSHVHCIINFVVSRYRHLTIVRVWNGQNKKPWRLLILNLLLKFTWADTSYISIMLCRWKGRQYIS